MSDAIVLLHGSANGSCSWGQVRRALAPEGAKVLAPDMLGYGGAPAPSEAWTLLEEVEHLRRSIDQLHDGKIHLDSASRARTSLRTSTAGSGRPAVKWSADLVRLKPARASPRAPRVEPLNG